MDEGIRYEWLLRKAFGFAQNGLLGDRSCDPADLAEAGLLLDRNLASVKIGAGYACAILSNAVINNVAKRLDDGEYGRLNGFIEHIIACETAKDLAGIIADYEDSVITRYFDVENGAIKLKMQ